MNQVILLFLNSRSDSTFFSFKVNFLLLKNDFLGIFLRHFGDGNGRAQNRIKETCSSHNLNECSCALQRDALFRDAASPGQFSNRLQWGRGTAGWARSNNLEKLSYLPESTAAQCKAQMSHFFLAGKVSDIFCMWHISEQLPAKHSISLPRCCFWNFRCILLLLSEIMSILWLSLRWRPLRGRRLQC